MWSKLKSEYKSKISNICRFYVYLNIGLAPQRFTYLLTYLLTLLTLLILLNLFVYDNPSDHISSDFQGAVFN